MYCTAKLPAGEVRGEVRNGILQFHGFPYAKAPVGNLRFCLPQPIEHWDGILDATVRGPIPPQGPSDLDLPMGSLSLDCNEDCLKLAVSTPSLNGRRPVAVWFHGGANCYNAGDLPWYDGGVLARNTDCVVVNLDFRLGPLGFLFHPAITQDNLSIEDQLCALRWIRDNIACFGGDPERVTLFGQSAGGNAIAHILSRPDSEGLFQQVVLQSASLGRGNHTTADANEIGQAVLYNLGIDPFDNAEALRQIRLKTTQQLLQAGDAVPGHLREKHKGMIFKPVMDAWHTPEQTVSAAAAEAIRRGIRIMIGFTRDEMDAFVPQRNGDLDKVIRQEQIIRYETPGYAFAQAAACGGCQVYKYQFDWSAPDSIYKACHCLELPFLFGNLDAWNAPMLAGAGRDEMERLSKTLQKLWGAFFRGETLDKEAWPAYTAEAPWIKHFDGRQSPVLFEAVKGLNV